MMEYALKANNISTIRRRGLLKTAAIQMKENSEVVEVEEWEDINSGVNEVAEDTKKEIYVIERTRYFE